MEHNRKSELIQHKYFSVTVEHVKVNSNVGHFEGIYLRNQKYVVL